MIKRVYHHLDEHVETYLATVALVVFTCLVVFQVIMRYIFNSPTSWSEEIAEFALAWFVYLSGSYAVRYQRHVKFNVPVDLLGRFAPVLKRLVQILVFILWLGFLGMMTFYAV